MDSGGGVVPSVAGGDVVARHLGRAFSAGQVADMSSGAGQVWSWVLPAAVSAGLASALSFQLIRRHLLTYVQPSFQLYICRILFIVPLCALQSFASFIIPSTANFFNALRGCYEAFVLYTFFTLLVNFVGGEELVVLNFSQMRRHIDHPFPCKRIFGPIRLNRKFLRWTKRGVMQFVFVKPATAIIALVLHWIGSEATTISSATRDSSHVLNFGEFLRPQFWISLSRGSLFMFIANNISVGVAMYSLILFYLANQRALVPFRPLPKFMCVKIVIFLSFWQSHAISALLHLGALPSGVAALILRPLGSGGATPLELQALTLRLNDWLLCLEMLMISLLHLAAFSPREFTYLPLDDRFGRHTDMASPSPAVPAEKPLRGTLHEVIKIGDFLLDAKKTFIKNTNRALEVPSEFPLQPLVVPKSSDGELLPTRREEGAVGSHEETRSILHAPPTAEEWRGAAGRDKRSSDHYF